MSDRPIFSFLTDDDVFHCENDSPVDMKIYISQLRLENQGNLDMAREQTNWEAFKNAVYKELVAEHEIKTSTDNNNVCPSCGEPYSGDCGPCSVGKCQG